MTTASPTRKWANGSAVSPVLCAKPAFEPGDRVAFLSSNCHRLLEAYYGVLEAGAVLLPLNIRLTPAELGYILNDSGATALFIEKQFLPVAEAFRKDIPTVKFLCQLDGAPEASWLSPKNYDALLGCRHAVSRGHIRR